MKPSIKWHDWQKFATKVGDHIEDYVVTQYGDQPDDHINGMSIEEVKGKMSSYVARIGKVQLTRGFETAKQDCFKLAHFAQYLHDKLVDEENR